MRSLTKKGTGTFGLSIRKRWSNNLFIVSASIRFLPLLVPPGNSDSIASRAAKKARTVRACRQMAEFLSRNDVLHETNPNPGLLANCCQQLRDKGKVTKVMQSSRQAGSERVPDERFASSQLLIEEGYTKGLPLFNPLPVVRASSLLLV